MSTHSGLGVKMEDESIIGCYVHFDGHTMKARIESFLKNHTTTDLAVLIAKAQATGGIRSFYCPNMDDESILETCFLEDNTPYVINETDFYEDHMFTYAWYLVDYKDSTVHVKEKQFNG